MEAFDVHTLRECSNRPEDHVYSVHLPANTALYYLAGYVVRKVLKATHCTECKKEAVGVQDSLPSEALLVLEREYVRGSLVYPSKKLFEVLGVWSTSSARNRRMIPLVTSFGEF